MSTPPKRPAPQFEIPDLEFDAPLPAPVGARRSPGARSQRPERFEQNTVPGASLELASDLDIPVSLGTSGMPAAEQAFGGTLPGSAVGGDFDLEDDLERIPVAQPVAHRPWPLGRTDRHGVQVEPADVSRVAGYGEPPPAYLTPRYSYRVWTRQRALRRALTEHQRELAAREAERAELLVRVVDGLRPELASNERFLPLLSAQAGVRQELERQRVRLAEVNQGLAAELGSSDQKLARLEAQRAAEQAVVDECTGKRDAASTDLERVNAKLKRLQIEKRNITQRARERLGPAGGDIPAELAEELARLEQAEQALEPERSSAEAHLKALEQELGQKRQRAAQTLESQELARADRRASLDKYRTTLDAGSQELAQAEQRHRDCAAEIAHAVLDLKGAVPVDRAVLDEIQKADETVRHALIEVETHRLALDAHDRAAYRTGLRLAGLPLALVLGLIVLELVL